MSRHNGSCGGGEDMAKGTPERGSFACSTGRLRRIKTCVFVGNRE